MPSRRRKSTPAQDIIAVVSLLPWWAALVLAVAGYVVFHALLISQKGLSPSQPGVLIAHAFLIPFYAVGQFIAPLLCVIAAGVSFARERHRTGLLRSVTSGQAADAIDALTWQDFEQLIGKAFALDGYRVVETGGGPDGGVDLILRRGNEKFLVQCKHWKAYKVGVEIVRELYGVMTAKGAAGGFVVTSGRFSRDAQAFAQGRNIRLIDGPKLHSMLQRIQAGQMQAPYSTPVSSPVCPLCGSRMVKRQATRGRYAGKEFWGCQSYPACRGIVELP